MEHFTFCAVFEHNIWISVWSHSKCWIKTMELVGKLNLWLGDSRFFWYMLFYVTFLRIVQISFPGLFTEMENLLGCSRYHAELINCHVIDKINDKNCYILGLWEKYSQISNYDVSEVQISDDQMYKQKFVSCCISMAPTNKSYIISLIFFSFNIVNK